MERQITICPVCSSSIPVGCSEDLCPACFLLAVGLGEDGEAIPDFDVPGITIRKEIARGGMGIIYLGEQRTPQRQVAVKVLQPQLGRNEVVRGRFRREAQAMAALEHPAILPVYEVGEVDGLPWFTMKLATGGSLADRIPAYREQWTRTAELIACLAGALDFAHHHGVLHRDIKPGNVLFDGDDRPYLGDFGVAKQESSIHSDQTVSIDMLGTPHYLPPEVASGGMEKVTTSGDIYALGAVLYELLSGRRPHNASNLPALLRQISDAVPPSLDAGSPAPPRDLVAVCGKAMEKEPEHRYATAGEMAQDLRNFLAGKPTAARPISQREAVWRWCRRHPFSAVLSISVIALLLILAVTMSIAAWRIKRAQNNAEAHLRETLLAQAASVRAARPPGFRERGLSLAEQAAADGESDAFRLRRRSEMMSTLAFPMVSELPLPPPPLPGMQFATASPNWQFIAWHDEKTDAWQVTQADGSPVFEGRGKGIPNFLSVDGLWLVTQKADQQWTLWRADVTRGSVVLTVNGVVQGISADNRFITSHVYVRPGLRLAQIREMVSGRIVMNVEYPNVALGMRFSPDGEYCAVAPSFYSTDTSVPYAVRIYRSRDGALIRELASELANCIWWMAWSPDGRSLMGAERDGPVYIWDANNGSTRHILRGPGTNIWRAAFSADGQRLATVSSDRLFTVFDLGNGKPLVQGQGQWRNGPAFYWQSDESFGPVMIEGRTSQIRFHPGAFTSYGAMNTKGGVLGIAVSPDARSTVLGDARRAWLWDHERRKPGASFAEGLWNSFCFSPDGQWLYGCGESGVFRWQIGPEGVGKATQLGPSGFHNCLSMDRSGTSLVFEREQDSHVSILRDLSSAEPVRTVFKPSQGLWLDISPDGRFLASGGYAGLKIWSVDDRKVIYEDKQKTQEIRFGPDGGVLFVLRDGYEIWSTNTWSRMVVLNTFDFGAPFIHVEFHPTEPLLVAGGSLGRIGIWSTKSWQLVGILENPNQLPVRRMKFEKNGRKLHFGSMAGIFATWDFEYLKNELAKRSLSW
jgi:WD40 repeat protein/predicted Ser/Thr protein kinase